MYSSAADGHQKATGAAALVVVEAKSCVWEEFGEVMEKNLFEVGVKGW